jgi:hypothetical protein
MLLASGSFEHKMFSTQHSQFHKKWTDSELLQTAIFYESQMENINHIGLPIS